MKHVFVCHEVLMLGKNPIKWRQRSDMSIAVDWDVKYQFKQTKRASIPVYSACILFLLIKYKCHAISPQHHSALSWYIICE